MACSELVAEARADSHGPFSTSLFSYFSIRNFNINISQTYFHPRLMPGMASESRAGKPALDRGLPTPLRKNMRSITMFLSHLFKMTILHIGFIMYWIY